MVKICFVLAADSLEAERKKWELESSLEALAEERLLVGMGMVLAVANVQSMLGNATAEQVATFLSKGKVKAVSAKTVQTMLKSNCYLSME